MTDKELSNLSMDRKECPKCGALWLNGQHYWSGTGKLGNELDLAGLVCNNCLLYTSPSPRDRQKSRMPSSA